MEHHAWLIFAPGDTDAARVIEAARHTMASLHGELDPRTETVDVQPDGTVLYRIVGNAVAWREWMAREGLQALCSERPDWPTFQDALEPPQSQRMPEED